MSLPVASILYSGLALGQRLAGFILILILARYVSPETVGRVSLLTVLYLLTSNLSNLGLDLPYVRFAALGRESDLSRTFTWHLAILSSAAPAALVMGAYAAGTLLDLGVGAAALAVGAGVLYGVVVSPALAVARAERHLVLVTLLQLVLITASAGKICILILDESVAEVVWAASDLLAVLFTALIVAVAFRRRIVLTLAGGYPREAFALGLPMLPQAVAHWVLGSSDRAMLAALGVGAGAIGVYNVSYQLVAVSGICAVEVNRSFMTTYLHTDTPRAHQAQVALAFLAPLAATAAAAVILGELLPAAYVAGLAYIWVLGLGQAFFALYLISATQLTITHGQSARLWHVTGSAGLVNFGTNALLIPILGPTAAAVATAGSYAALCVGAAWLVHQARKAHRDDYAPSRMSVKQVARYTVLLLVFITLLLAASQSFRPTYADVAFHLGLAAGCVVLAVRSLSKAEGRVLD